MFNDFILSNCVIHVPSEDLFDFLRDFLKDNNLNMDTFFSRKYLIYTYFRENTCLRVVNFRLKIGHFQDHKNCVYEFTSDDVDLIRANNYNLRRVSDEINR